MKKGKGLQDHWTLGEEARFLESSSALAWTLTPSAQLLVSGYFNFCETLKFAQLQTFNLMQMLISREEIVSMQGTLRTLHSSALLSCRGNSILYITDKSTSLGKNHNFILDNIFQPSLSLEFKTKLCSYLQNGIYKLLLRNAQKTVLILPPSIKDASPCFIEFSTKGCNNIGGTISDLKFSSTFTSTVSRS